MTEPLTPEELDRYRAMLSDPVTRAHMDRASLLRAADAFLATLDAARSTSEELDVDRLNAAIRGHREFVPARDFDHRCSGVCAGSIAREYAALRSEDEG